MRLDLQPDIFCSHRQCRRAAGSYDGSRAVLSRHDQPERSQPTAEAPLQDSQRNPGGARLPRLHAPETDSEKQALRRFQEMAPKLVQFIKDVRRAEGFLKPAHIDGPREPGKNRHNDLQHQLAKAQRAFGLVGVRESRAWAYMIFRRIGAMRTIATKSGSFLS